MPLDSGTGCLGCCLTTHCLTSGGTTPGASNTTQTRGAPPPRGPGDPGRLWISPVLSTGRRVVTRRSRAREPWERD